MNKKTNKKEERGSSEGMLSYLDNVIGGIETRFEPGNTASREKTEDLSVETDKSTEEENASMKNDGSSGKKKAKYTPARKAIESNESDGNSPLDAWFDKIREQEMPLTVAVHLNEDVLNAMKKIKIATKLPVGGLVNQIVIDWLEKHKNDLSERLRSSNKFVDI